MHVVWFKRDLRTSDHVPLADAAEHGAVLPLYIVEPGLWRQPDVSSRHWDFCAESVSSLDRELRQLGQRLIVRVGEAVETLASIHAQTPISALWSHEETGNAWTYARDRAVKAWCRANSIPWHEVPQTGVARPLRSRQGWAGRWNRRMREPLVPPPRALEPVPDVSSDRLPRSADLGLQPNPCPERQRGGRDAALTTLESFLVERGEPYRRAMSSPLDGATHCSRLSPHLAWGTLSMKEVSQASNLRRQQLEQIGASKAWRDSMKSFTSRLHWHCHFMQKLEDDPAIEFRNLHPAYDGIRDASSDPSILNAWQSGETGIPFVDACMRSLSATGWINFRMRAMLMSFASYHLWLDWRKPGEHLARCFTDYEPGIHWSQVQMQSGTTGINTPRIYNPVKQGYDQDPTGAFIRRWIPELDAVPDAFVQEPWRWEQSNRLLGSVYPVPVVDHLAAARTARQRIWAVRKERGFREQARAITTRHGSRKRPPGRRTGKGKGNAPRQLSLEPIGDQAK